MLNGYDTFVILTLVFLLLICFFIMGYMFAKRRFMRFFNRYLNENRFMCQNALKKPKNVEIREIKVDSKEKFEEMMKNLFENLQDEEEDEDDDTRGND